MPVSKEKQNALEEKMRQLNISEDDLIEKFILGSGSGGQKINKTASCVYLKHIPTGIEVKCQQDRSREMNRYFARKELCEKIEKTIYLIQTEKDKELHKIRKQKKRRSRRSKEKMLEEKKTHSDIKMQRRTPKVDDN